ncbi:DUF488 family protein [Streptomyces sp. NBC_01808]|uniref:DUF488 domain-containing protein n=1 Tax=Streptomyces sp. NBC_01808 TaxID=2975947 RepID=UPI002DDBFC9B|nr:DUF488 family protein [Streptomyces sp. NBC_01808]WSA38875.1 DUF488 family protein [Streptomyces sp. NBC_01808]
MTTKHAPPRIRRVYDAPAEDDGRRVLVDRIWPRGMTKEKAHIDEWLKAIAPSDELRHWLHADFERYPDFVKRYRKELADHERAEALAHLRALYEQGPLTLVTSTKEVQRSHLTVLAEELERG